VRSCGISDRVELPARNLGVEVAPGALDVDRGQPDLDQELAPAVAEGQRAVSPASATLANGREKRATKWTTWSWAQDDERRVPSISWSPVTRSADSRTGSRCARSTITWAGVPGGKR